jgi:hypothetical protein
MADVLIRGVPDEVVHMIDAKAEREGISRSEYLRRLLAREAPISTEPIEVGAFRRLAALAGDLANPAVMGDAWS